MTITIVHHRSCRHCGERFHYADPRVSTRRELIRENFKPPLCCPDCFARHFGPVAAEFRRSSAEANLIDSALAG